MVLPMMVSLSLTWQPMNMTATMATMRDEREDECVFGESLAVLVAISCDQAGESCERCAHGSDHLPPWRLIDSGS